ncbi:elongation factor 1-delta-like protein [Tanacetum coccineum]
MTLKRMIMNQNLKVGWVLWYFFEFVSDNGSNEKFSIFAYLENRLVDNKAMAPTFFVGSEAGLKKLDEYLLSRSYITGYQASKDDLTVHAAFTKPPSPQYVNVSRWYNHITALLRISDVFAEGNGVIIEGSATFPEEAIATPPVAETKACYMYLLLSFFYINIPMAAEDEDEDDDSDVDLFGEETEEEKKAAEERAAAVKASGKKKESGKSSILLDVKPWDDETDMQKLEEAVRSVQMEGLTWGASKLVPVGYGIKKLQVMMTIVDDLVSIDSVIEDRLTTEPISEYVQSCDIVAFNKIFM